MGKIVKYCSSCDEGFSEKFGFCPNCAAQLQAFEMNPVDKAAAGEQIVDVPAAEPAVVPDTVSMSAAETESLLEIPAEEGAEPAGEVTTAVATEEFEQETAPIEIENADVIESEPEEVYAAAPTVASAAPTAAWASPTETNDNVGFHDYTPGHVSSDDGGYYVTVIQERNGKQRNLLLLGSLILIMTLAVGSTIVSLFQKDLGVGAIGDERSLAYLLEDVPMPVEDMPEEKKNDDKDGGGGGGGKEDPEPVNKGDLPDQTPNPLRPPDPKVHQSDNFELKMPPPSTEGIMKNEKKYGRWGDPNAFGDIPSSGPGSGGGMGTGIGTGAGSGRGTGQGSGVGSGAGSGYGDGYGDGSGGGSGGVPPPKALGVSSPLKILSKPQAKYNDAGRTNGVQGSVRLKVTLLASGAVGSITPVTRLPHGLTEQAIAAARLIKFEPAKQNGIPISKTVTIDYTFSIY